jgi:hypothetical protein
MYVELYMYETYATHLLLCNYNATILQLLL